MFWSKRLVLETDFSSNETVFQSDLVVTDWSTICYEFSFTTKRPTLFVDTPTKIMNPEYERIGIMPLDIFVRKAIGKSISPKEAGQIRQTVDELLLKTGDYAASIENLMNECLYHPGESSRVAGEYIINQMISRQTSRKKR